MLNFHKPSVDGLDVAVTFSQEAMSFLFVCLGTSLRHWLARFLASMLSDNRHPLCHNDKVNLSMILTDIRQAGASWGQVCRSVAAIKIVL